MLRLRVAAVVGVTLALLGFASSATARPSRRSVALTALESGVLTDINAFRQQHGLQPLRLSRSLSAAARQHSVEMAVRGYFSHTSANGTSFDRRIARYYPVAHSRFWSVGENLLWSSPDVNAGGALEMWENSPPHRANLLTARWREIGVSAVHVAVARGTFGARPVTIVTTDFGVRR
jgi:uncharacterized protein YkwD